MAKICSPSCLMSLAISQTAALCLWAFSHYLQASLPASPSTPHLHLRGFSTCSAATCSPTCHRSPSHDGCSGCHHGHLDPHSHSTSTHLESSACSTNLITHPPQREPPPPQQNPRSSGGPMPAGPAAWLLGWSVPSPHVGNLPSKAGASRPPKPSHLSYWLLHN